MMYPSTCNNNNNPSLYSYNANMNLSKTLREHYRPPSSSSSSSFQLSSPHYITLEDGTIFNELLRRQNMILSDDHRIHNASKNIGIDEHFTSLQSDIRKCSNNNADNDDGFNKPKNSSTKRRSSNDRHNKINTAQGPRDRRMRLSFDVAKKFFKLHDILGFDKASNTVEWLLNKSESYIQELYSVMGVSSEASSTSKYELLCESIKDNQNEKFSSSKNHKEKRKTSSGVRKMSYRLRPLAKETRDMARKRARERTVEKMMSSRLGCVSGGDDQFSKFRTCWDQKIHQNVNRLGSCIINQPELPSSLIQSKQVTTGDNSSSMTGNWNPSFLFKYQPTGVLTHEVIN